MFMVVLYEMGHTRNIYKFILVLSFFGLGKAFYRDFTLESTPRVACAGNEGEQKPNHDTTTTQTHGEVPEGVLPFLPLFSLDLCRGCTLARFSHDWCLAQAATPPQ